MTRLYVIVAALAAALSACGGSGTDLVVYSGRNEALFKPILDDFAKDTGLNVSVRFADTTELAGTLIEEGENPRADVFIGQDAGALARLDERGRLARFESPALDRVPQRFRSENGTWTGLSARARVLIVNTEELPEAQWPDSVFDLVDKRWKGKIAAPGITNASWIGFVSEMRLERGDEVTRRFLEGLERNDIAVLGSHTDVRNAVGTGEFEIGLVNHYYVELEKREGSPVEAVFTDQAPDDMGAVVNVASGGIVSGAPNPGNARRLLEYLLEDRTQEKLAGLNYEYPVVPGVPAPGLKPLDDIRATDVPLSALGAEVDSTLAMLREVGLDE